MIGKRTAVVAPKNALFAAIGISVLLWANALAAAAPTPAAPSPRATAPAAQKPEKVTEVEGITEYRDRKSVV